MYITLKKIWGLSLMFHWVVPISDPNHQFDDMKMAFLNNFWADVGAMMGAQRNYLLDMIDIPYGDLRHAYYPKTVPSRSHNLHFSQKFQICKPLRGQELKRCIHFCRVRNQDAIFTNLGTNFVMRPSSWCNRLSGHELNNGRGGLDRDSMESKTLPLLEV